MGTFQGEILAAKEYAGLGDFVSAEEVLDEIPSRIDLDSQEEVVILEVQKIFDIMESPGVDNLSQNNIDTLYSVIETHGHSSSMARAILRFYGFGFESNYVLPDTGYYSFQASSNLEVKSEEQEIENTDLMTHDLSLGSTEDYEISLGDIKIFPNPSNGAFVHIVIPSNKDITKPVIENANLKEGENVLELSESMKGLYIFRITND